METFRMESYIRDECVIGFKSEQDIWNQIDDLGTHSFIILFDDQVPTNQFHYTIRSKTNQLHTDQQYSKNLPDIALKASNEYIREGFLGLQHALNEAYLAVTSKKEDAVYRIELQRFPLLDELPEESYIKHIGLYLNIFSAFISISLIFTKIIEEKDCGFREQLKNATRFSFLNNVALFTLNHLQMLTLFFTCLIITYIKGFWFSVNVFYPALLLTLFVTSIISFTFMVSAFFESSKFECSVKIFKFLTKI